jgi:putative ABC transport system permease protein
VISHRLNLDYGYQVGDVIEIQDSEFRSIQVTVSGIMQNFVGNYVYIHPETYKEQVGKEASYKTLYVNLMDSPFVDAHEVSASLMKLDEVTAVSVSADTMERFDSMMASIDYIVLLVILCAAALAFIVIYNLTNINITERVREIATIKVLGFYKNETASYVFRENLLLTVVGAVVGIGLGKLLHWFIMQVLRVDLVTFDVRIELISYLYAVLLTFLFALGVNAMMTGKLEKISMTESLKSVD